MLRRYDVVMTLVVLPWLADAALLPNNPPLRCTAYQQRSAYQPVLSQAPPVLSLEDHKVLGPLAEAALRAVRDSTGKGEESSGSGRPEWGTWCDADLFEDVRTALNRITLFTADGTSWPRLWEVAGGEASNATLQIASDEHFDVVLRIFASPAGLPNDARMCSVRRRMHVHMHGEDAYTRQDTCTCIHMHIYMYVCRCATWTGCSR